MLRVAGNVMNAVLLTTSDVRRDCDAIREVGVRVDNGRVRDAEHLWKARRILLTCADRTSIKYCYQHVCIECLK